MNANFALESAIAVLPEAFRGHFDWVVDGITYRYSIKARAASYTSNHRLPGVAGEFDVRARISITKVQCIRVLGLELPLEQWTIDLGFVNLFGPSDRDGIFRSAAKSGIMPSDLLLDKCLDSIKQPIAQIRDAAINARVNNAKARLVAVA